MQVSQTPYLYGRVSLIWGPFHTMAKFREERRLDQWICINAQSPSSRPSHSRPTSFGRRLQKSLGGSTFRPLQPCLGRAKCSSQTSVERPSFFWRSIILIDIFNPKASPLDLGIVWSGPENQNTLLYIQTNTKQVTQMTIKSDPMWYETRVIHPITASFFNQPPFLQSTILGPHNN